MSACDLKIGNVAEPTEIEPRDRPQSSKRLERRSTPGTRTVLPVFEGLDV